MKLVFDEIFFLMNMVLMNLYFTEFLGPIVQGRHVDPRVGFRVPSTVANSSAFPDVPPTVVESMVWPDVQIQASSDDGGVLRQTPTCSTIPASQAVLRWNVSSPDPLLSDRP